MTTCYTFECFYLSLLLATAKVSNTNVRCQMTVLTRLLHMPELQCCGFTTFLEIMFLILLPFFFISKFVKHAMNEKNKQMHYIFIKCIHSLLLTEVFIIFHKN